MLKRIFTALLCALSLLFLAPSAHAQFDYPTGVADIQVTRTLEYNGDITLTWEYFVSPTSALASQFQSVFSLNLNTYGAYYDLTVAQKLSPLVPSKTVGFGTAASPGGTYKGRPNSYYVFSAAVTFHNPRNSPWSGTTFGAIRANTTGYGGPYRSGTHGLLLLPLSGGTIDVVPIQLLENF